MFIYEHSFGYLLSTGDVLVSGDVKSAWNLFSQKVHSFKNAAHLFRAQPFAIFEMEY